MRTAAIGAAFVCAFVFIGTVVESPGNRNEASAIGALRSINSAQRSYASACGQNGYAASLADLARPPAGASNGFISPDLSGDGVERAGYIVGLTASPGSTQVADFAETCNGTRSVSGYFALAAPSASNETGGRSFAIDARGTVYVNATGGTIDPDMNGAIPLN